MRRRSLNPPSLPTDGDATPPIPVEDGGGDGGDASPPSRATRGVGRSRGLGVGLGVAGIGEGGGEDEGEWEEAEPTDFVYTGLFPHEMMAGGVGGGGEGGETLEQPLFEDEAMGAAQVQCGTMRWIV